MANDVGLKISISSLLDSSGFDKATKSIADVDAKTKGLSASNELLSSSFLSLKSLLPTIGFGLLAKEAVEMADTYKLMNARLELVSKNTSEYLKAQTSLFAMSQDTRSSLEATTALYTKVSMSVENLGKSQNQILAFTKSVNESMKISGATTQEATATVLQLSQALQSGKLQGDEYRSLRENAPRLAKAIADGMGVEIGALKQLSTDGKLTAEVVFNAIEKSGKQLDEEYKKIPATVSDAFTELKNEALLLTGKLDSATGASSRLSSSIIDFTKNVNDSADDIVVFGQFSYAVLDRTKDMLMLVGAVAKNTLELAIGGIAATVYGFMSGIADMVLYATQALNSIGLSSDKTLDGAKTTAESMKKIYHQSVASINEDWEDINKAIAKASPTVEDRIAQMKRLGVETKKVANEAGKINHTPSETPEQKKAREAAEKEAQKQAKEARELEQKLFNERINDGIKNFEEEIKVKRGYIEAYADIEAKNAIATYELNKNLSDQTKQLTLSDYEYKSNKLKEQYEEYAKITDDKLLLDQWYSAEKNKLEKDSWADNNKFWANLFENINKAMENQFFDAMTGKFKSFGSWLKDFWGSITESMTRGLSKTLADTIMGTGSNSSGGIANWFKSYGGFGSVFGSFATPSALVGATTDGAGFTTTAGGTVYDAAGQITKGGSDLAAVTDALSAASGISAIYSAATGAIADTVATNFGLAGSYLGELTGSASIADGVGSFGMGLSSPFAGYGAGGAAGIGSVVGGAALGGLGGYALGSLGDALMGKDTKAGTYGAIGGAAGAVVGSVVPVIGTALGAVVGAALGSLIGGIFGGGKTSQVGSGFDVTANTGSTQNIRDYVKIHQSGGWFSGDREWYEYGALTTQQKTQIKGTFDTYNYLLEQLGSSNKVYLQAGKYTASAFNDALAKSFMEGFTETSITDEIYSYWSNYATSISKTVAEALTTTVGTYITESRTFQEWKLGSGTTDQLKFTSDYLAKDLQSLESQMGVSGITVENYLSKYEEAMKTAFTPETINTWKSLGDALMAATDANQKYIDSLNQTTSLIPTDMMLSKGVDGTQIFQSMTNQNDTLKYSFSEMITVLKKILFNQQFGNTITGTPMP